MELDTNEQRQRLGLGGEEKKKRKRKRREVKKLKDGRDEANIISLFHKHSLRSLLRGQAITIKPGQRS